MNSFPTTSYLGGKQYAIHLHVICIYIFYYMIRNLFSHCFTATGAQDQCSTTMSIRHCLTPQFQWTPKMEQPLRNLSHAYDQNENGKHLIWLWFNCRFRFTEIVVRSHSFHLIQWKTFHPWLIAFSSLTFQWVSKYFANDSKGKNVGVEWVVVPN